MAEAAAGETAQKERASDGERWSGRRRRARAAIAMAAAWAVFGWEIWGEVDGDLGGTGKGWRLSRRGTWDVVVALRLVRDAPDLAIAKVAFAIATAPNLGPS